MKETFLKVVSVSAPIVGKDNVNYKLVEYQGFVLIGSREAAIKGTVKQAVFPPSYERTRDGVTTKFTGDPEYDTIQAGDIFAGEIFSCPTTDYKISEDGQFVRTWRGVVFSGKNPWVIAAKALRDRFAKPLMLDEETGKMIPFILPAQQPANKPAAGVKLTDDVPAGAGATDDQP